MDVDLEAGVGDDDTLKGQDIMFSLHITFADFRLPSFEPEEPLVKRLGRSVDRIMEHNSEAEEEEGDPLLKQESFPAETSLKALKRQKR